MKTILVADPVRYPRMTTQELRDSFLVENLYEAGALHLAYTDLDRAIVGLAAPLTLSIAMIWLAHIGFDRALGYGLKYATGFGFTHLGRIGRNAASN